MEPAAASSSSSAPRDGVAWAERAAEELAELPRSERRAALTLLNQRLQGEFGEVGGVSTSGATIIRARNKDAHSRNGGSSSSGGGRGVSPPPSPPAVSAPSAVGAGSGSRRGIIIAIGIGILVLGSLLRTASRSCTAAESVSGSSHLRHAQRGPLGPSALGGSGFDCPAAPPCICPRCPAAAAEGGTTLPRFGKRGRRRRGEDAAAASTAVALQGGVGGYGNGMPREGEEYPYHSAFQHPSDALRWLRPTRNTSDFPLLVCIGQGKTATKSLNKALVMLGYQTAHFYGAGIYGLLYDNAAEAKNHEFLFNVHEAKHVDAVLDTPVVEFYNEILLAYPNARIILTIRSAKSWLKSQQKFYCCFARGCKNWLAPWRRGSNLVYGTECPTREQAIKRYVQHNRNVYDNVPRDRLLVMDIPGGDGWEKLVPFLNSFLPNKVPYPPPNMTFPSRH